MASDVVSTWISCRFSSRGCRSALVRDTQVVWAVRAVLLLYVSQQLFFSWVYGAMMRRNKLNVDKYTKSEPGLRDRAFVAFTHW